MVIAPPTRIYNLLKCCFCWTILDPSRFRVSVFFIAGREALLLPMEAIGEVNGEATPGKKDRTMVMVNDA
jgi:hypothetical protein